jgi:hypothetical protein
MANNAALELKIFKKKTRQILENSSTDMLAAYSMYIKHIAPITLIH